MPSRTEATRAKAALCATGRLTPLRLFSTLPFSSPFPGSMSVNAINEMVRRRVGFGSAVYIRRIITCTSHPLVSI